MCHEKAPEAGRCFTTMTGNIITMTPYFDDGLRTIYCGDVLDVLAALGDTFDLVFTSPPYNLGVNPGGQFGHWKDGGNRGGAGKWKGVTEAGIGYTSHEDAMPPAAYREWQRAVLTSCWDRLTDSGAIFYNHKPRVQASSLWMPLELNPDLPIRQIITWDRSSGPNFTATAYVPVYEWIIVFAKPAWRLTTKGAGGCGDVWRIPPAHDNPHPAPFPVGLPSRAIESCSPTSVLDPFCGSGSTLVAAQTAGIRAVGIDNDERYCEMAAERLTGRLSFGEAVSQ